MRATTDRKPAVVPRCRAAMMVFLGVLSVACSDDLTDGDRIRGSGAVTQETRSIGGFERVVLAGEGNVLFGSGSDGVVEVESDDNLLGYIRTDVSGDTLTISTEPGVDIDPTDGVIYRLGCPEMSAVVLSGAGSIDLAACTTTDRLQVDLPGAGTIVAADLGLSMLRASLPGAGSIFASGRTDQLDVIVAGAGDFDGADLRADVVSVESLGVGAITVWAVTDLYVSVSGVGTVAYYGDPEVSQSVTGVGTIKGRGPK